MYSISNRLSILYRVQLYIFHAFHTIPFTWNCKNKFYVRNTHHYRRFRQECWINPIFFLFQTYQLTKQIQQGNLDEALYICLMWISNIISCAHLYALVYKYKEYMLFLNGVISFGKTIASKSQLFNLINFYNSFKSMF